MANVTNANDARYQIEIYIDDSVVSLEAAEKILSNIDFGEDIISSIESAVDSALDEIKEALKALRG